MANELEQKTTTIVPRRPRLRWPVVSRVLLVLLLVSAPLAGQENEEQSYAPTEVLACELDFAVLALASAWGELATVRECPRADGNGLTSFAARPILEARHVDSVAVEVSGADRRRVVVRWTEQGGRKMFVYWDHSPPDPVSIVVDGEVMTELELSDGRTASRAVVLDEISPDRAKEFAARLRMLVARASNQP